MFFTAKMVFKSLTVIFVGMLAVGMSIPVAKDGGRVVIANNNNNTAATTTKPTFTSSCEIIGSVYYPATPLSAAPSTRNNLHIIPGDTSTLKSYTNYAFSPIPVVSGSNITLPASETGLQYDLVWGAMVKDLKFESCWVWYGGFMNEDGSAWSNMYGTVPKGQVPTTQCSTLFDC